MIAQLNRAYLKATPFKVFPRVFSYLFMEGRPATTKGRWFNPLTFAFIRLAGKSKQKVEAESPLFITGTGRSGSTILGMVLSTHPDILFLNEPKALWYLANHDDDIIGSYSKSGGKYIMAAKDLTAGCASFIKAAYSTALRLTGSKKIVDKYPEMLFRTDYLCSVFENPKFIFLTRNAEETISSTTIWSNKNRSADQSEDWWGVDGMKWKLMIDQLVTKDEMLSQHLDEIKLLTSDTDKAAVEWIVSMNHGMNEILKYPDRILRIRYEDLCLDSDKELKRICDFADVRPDQIMLSYGQSVIKRQKPHNKVALHPVLQKAIEKVNFKLGYGPMPEVTNVTE